MTAFSNTPIFQLVMAPVTLRFEQRLNEIMRVERKQVINLLADTDILDGQPEFARDGDHHPALGGAIKLGENNAGCTGMLNELTGLGKAVLSGCCVKDQQHLVGSASDLAPRDSAHLFELGHQIELRMKAARGIHDHGIVLAFLRSGERVVDHGSGVCPRLLLDYFSVDPLRPYFELFCRGGAESVRRAQKGAPAPLHVKVSELCDAGGLAHSVDADDEDDLGHSLGGLFGWGCLATGSWRVL